jgi:hypothetical protein
MSASAGHATDIYVIDNPHIDQRLVAQALTNPAVTGSEIVLNWNVLEPASGIFSWQALDNAIALTMPGQHLSLAIVTGAYAPSWLAAAPTNVPFLNFAYGARTGQTHGCKAISMPVPYVPAYVMAYDGLMQALAQHLASTGALNSVALVKTTGIDTITEENHLPSLGCSDSDPADPQQTTTQVAMEWQHAGFRSGVVENAWKQMTDAIATDFPNAVISFDIHATELSSFPPIDRHGHIVNPLNAPNILQNLINYGIAAYPSRFSTQWDGVSDIRPIPAPIVLALCDRKNAVAGWQSNEFFAVQGAGCGATQPDGATLCTDTTYLNLLNNAKASCGTTMEVWPIDVINHAASFAAFAAE